MKPLLAIFGILALGGGVGLGMMLMTEFFNYHFEERPFVEGNVNSKQISAKGSGPQEAQANGTGAPSDPLPAGPKRDLAVLVAKLDQLTGQPIELSLTDKQRGELLEQLCQAEELDKLSEEEVKNRLDASLKALEEHKGALDAVGYHWPGATPTPPSLESHAKHVNALRAHLDKSKNN
jgi:hypothetical protein